MNDGRPIVFMDETYLHSTHTQPQEWTDGSSAGIRVPVAKGKRLIIVHAGGKMGFIPGGLLMFRSETKSGDYHDDMNFVNFQKWLENQLIPNLPPASVLVLDNASYHNVKLNKDPTSGTLKMDMIKWLVDRNISHDPTLTKSEIYEIIKQYKSKYQKYAVDSIMSRHGHRVLRLPP